MLACPECHSTELGKFGTKWVGTKTNGRKPVQQYICKKCGRKTINPILAQYRNAQGRFTKAGESSTTPTVGNAP
jgi:uncharacterized protein YlaI